MIHHLEQKKQLLITTGCLSATCLSATAYNLVDHPTCRQGPNWAEVSILFVLIHDFHVSDANAALTFLNTPLGRLHGLGFVFVSQMFCGWDWLLAPILNKAAWLKHRFEGPSWGTLARWTTSVPPTRLRFGCSTVSFVWLFTLFFCESDFTLLNLLLENIFFFKANQTSLLKETQN